MSTVSQELAKYTTQAQMSSFFIDKVGQIWVSAYGAVGDGVTDDTTAVQNAVNAAVAAGISEVNFVGGKTYKITSLSNTTGLTFLGTDVTITGGASINVASLSSHMADSAKNLKTDFNSSLAAAATYFNANGGGHLYIPKGTFTLSDMVNFNCSNLTIEGTGKGSIIAVTGLLNTRRGMININSTDHGAGTTRYSGITIKNICLDMSAITEAYWDNAWDADPWFGRGALSIQSCDHVRVKNIYVKEACHTAIILRGCYDYIVAGCAVEGLKGFTVAGGVVKDGNCINAMPVNFGVAYTYDGPLGHGKIFANDIIGDTGSYPPVITNDITTTGNIGIMAQMGEETDADRTNDVRVFNNTIKKCWYGIVAEGMYNGGAGDACVNGNTIENCVIGIELLPDSNADADNSYNFSCTGNKLKNIYGSGIVTAGHNVDISHNEIVDWGMALAAETWLASGMDAFAIRCLPCEAANTSGTYSGLIVSDNRIRLTAAHDNTYKVAIQGLRVDSYKEGITFKDIHIHDNIIDGKLTAYSTGSACSGMTFTGNLVGLDVHDNTVTGFPNFAVYISPVDGSTDWTKTPIDVKIHHNHFCDNLNKSGLQGAAISILTANGYYNIEDNDFYDTVADATYGIVSVPTKSGAEQGADYFTIRNNKIKNFLYGGTDIISLATTGTHMIIEGNDGYNYRAAAPTATGYYCFTDTFIQKIGIAEAGSAGSKYMIKGWRCTVKGKPGTWLEERVLTGN